MFGIRDIRRNVSPKFIEICSGRSREGARPSPPPPLFSDQAEERPGPYLSKGLDEKKKERNFQEQLTILTVFTSETRRTYTPIFFLCESRLTGTVVIATGLITSTL